jgi:aspartate aminotransferase-like enzyme
MTSDRSLLDQPALTAAELVELDGAVASLLGTADEIVVVQAEAILTLEAVAKSLAAPDATAINVVTGPYGALFGDWMRTSGATVVDVIADFDRVATAEQVEAAFAAHPQATILAFVHAEAATGGTNPVAEIAAVGRRHDAVIVLDAVASIGAEPVHPTDWGIDVTVIGGQKSLAGPAGVSAVAISERAWALIEANLAAPRASFLSLLDLRAAWIQAGREAVAGTPNTLETRALLQALARVAEEGIDGVIDRHSRARAATLAGAAVLGLETWQHGSVGFAPVVTALRMPASGFDASAALGGIVSRGNGPLAPQLVRVNHTGRRATLVDVQDAVSRLAAATGATASAIASAAGATAAAWDGV